MYARFRGVQERIPPPQDVQDRIQQARERALTLRNRIRDYWRRMSLAKILRRFKHQLLVAATFFAIVALTVAGIWIMVALCGRFQDHQNAIIGIGCTTVLLLDIGVFLVMKNCGLEAKFPQSFRVLGRGSLDAHHNTEGEYVISATFNHIPSPESPDPTDEPGILQLQDPTGSADPSQPQPRGPGRQNLLKIDVEGRRSTPTPPSSGNFNYAEVSRADHSAFPFDPMCSPLPYFGASSDGASSHGSESVFSPKSPRVRPVRWADELFEDNSATQQATSDQPGELQEENQDTCFLYPVGEENS